MRSHFILAAVLLFCTYHIYAQGPFLKGIKARSITISQTSQQGQFRDIGFNAFSSKARFGELFDDPGAYTWYGDWSGKSLDISMNFHFKDSARFRHEFLAGIQNMNQKVYWLEGDQLAFKGRSEWMKFQVGYKYYLLKRKRFQVSTGLTADIGFTVSSFTRESTAGNRNEFFGWKQMQVGFSAPVLVSLRIFKKAYLLVGPAYGVGYRTQDGFGQVIFHRGLNAGFRFNI